MISAVAKRMVLILYSANANATSAILDHLQSFATYSKHTMLFVDAVDDAKLEFDLSSFDAVIVHYSVRLSLPSHLSASFAKELESYQGAKILFIQDEYENTETSRMWMEQLKFDVVFTCVAEKNIDRIYPKTRFPKTKFVNNLTGYVPDRLMGRPLIPIKERKNWIVYRGRALHPVYGMLGWEKQFIGEETKRRAAQRSWPVDIEWNDSLRIYGDSWLDFLSSSRATLGTESGSNLFDFDGTLRAKVDEITRANPSATFEEIYNNHLRSHEGRYGEMNQLSPKIFEAISLGTVLILFEGTYSNVLVPHRHFIPLKKDFSNFEEVAGILANTEALQRIADLAYSEIVQSGNFSFEKLVRRVDGFIEELVPKPRHAWQVVNPVIALVDPSNKASRPLFLTNAAFAPTLAPIHFKTITSLTESEKARVRSFMKIVVNDYFLRARRTLNTFALIPILLLNRVYHFFPENIKTALRPTVKQLKRAMHLK